MEECMLTGNVGEWSETYVLLRILEAGRLFAADEKLQLIKGKYYPVLKVFRNERDINAPSANKIVFDLLENDGKVTVYRNDLRVVAIDRCKFGEESDYLYSVLASRIKGEKNAFSVLRTQQFMQCA